MSTCCLAWRPAESSCEGGVGKTIVMQALLALLRHGAVLDAEDVGRVNPWVHGFHCSVIDSTRLDVPATVAQIAAAAPEMFRAT